MVVVMRYNLLKHLYLARTVRRPRHGPYMRGHDRDMAPRHRVRYDQVPAPRRGTSFVLLSRRPKPSSERRRRHRLDTTDPRPVFVSGGIPDERPRRAGLVQPRVPRDPVRHLPVEYRGAALGLAVSPQRPPRPQASHATRYASRLTPQAALSVDV